MGHILLLAPFLIALAGVPFALPFGRNLEYEYATAAAWLCLFALPILALFIPRRLVAESFDLHAELPPTNILSKVFSRTMSRSVWMLMGAPMALMLPGVVAFVSKQCQCSRNGFFFWMLVQAIPAVWLGMGLFWLVLRFRYDEKQAFRRISLLFGVVATLILLGFAIMWFAPQKRQIHILLGFLHGPIYDQWIPVDSGVVLHRLLDGLIGWCLAWFAWRGFRRSWRVPLITMALIASLYFAIGSYPSIGWGHKSLIERIPREITKGFITLHYDVGNEETDREMRVLLDESVFHAEDLAKILDVKKPRPIQIYVYPSDDVKKSYFGGGATDVTDVWTPSIHITRVAVPHPTLRHELVHAIASQFGWHGLGFHPNMLITEGLAMALAPIDERRDLDEASAALLKSGRVKHIEDLFSPSGFWSQSGGRAYMIAGSFLSFLLREAGAEAVREVYAGRTIADSTHRSLKEWLKRWRIYVDSRYDPKRSIENESLFRAPGVLRDLCPHTRADYAKSRAENIWLRLRQPAGWDPSDWSEWRSQIAPTDLNAKVDLWRDRIKIVASDRAIDEGAIATWFEVVQHAQHMPAQTIEDLELGIIETDLLSLQDRRSDSQKKLAALVSSIKIRPPGEFMERQILARQRVEDQISDPQRARDWRRYLAGWRTIPEVLPDDPWITSYLRMRRERHPNRDLVLANALLPVEDMDPIFRTEWYKITASRLLSFEDYENASGVYRDLLKTASGGRRSYYELQLRMATHLKKPSSL